MTQVDQTRPRPRSCADCGEMVDASAQNCSGCGTPLAPALIDAVSFEDQAASLPIGFEWRRLKRPAALIVSVLLACIVLLYIAAHTVVAAKLNLRQRGTGILVNGDIKFQENLCDALDLLRVKSFSDFDLVTNYIRAITQGPNGGQSYADIWVCPIVVVLTADATSNLQWCASGLVHEATHLKQVEGSKLRNKGLVAFADVVGRNAEIQANEAQLKTLLRLGAPSYMADLVRSDQGKRGAELLSAWHAQHPSATNETAAQVCLRDANPALWAKLQKFYGSRKLSNDCGTNAY